MQFIEDFPTLLTEEFQNHYTLVFDLTSQHDAAKKSFIQILFSDLNHVAIAKMDNFSLSNLLKEFLNPSSITWDLTPLIRYHN